MSTFAVFGMTKAKATADARKRVKTYDTIGGKVVNFPESEWLARVETEVEKTMAGERDVQLSEAFDAPEFARAYLDLCNRLERSRGLHVRYRKRSDHPDPKTGKHKYSWEEWKK